MNIQDLKYFHELIKLKSYTKTAEKFGVSQPTITAAIKRLENKFNTKFIIRDQSHKSIIITRIGMQFDQHVQTILNEVNIASEEIKQATGADISFGLPPIIGRNYFPKLVPKLLDHAVLNHLDVTESGSLELHHLLRTGQLDFALLGLTQIMLGLTMINPSPFIDLVTIKEYPISIIVSKNNPLAKKDKIYFKEIAQQPFISLSNDYTHTKALENMTHKNKITLNILYKSPDIRVIKSLVSQNLGISYLTTLAITPDDHIKVIPLLDSVQPKFMLVAAKRKNHIMTNREEALWQIITHHS